MSRVTAAALAAGQPWGLPRRGCRISGNTQNPVRTDGRNRGMRSVAWCRTWGRKQSRSEPRNRNQRSSWIKNLAIPGQDGLTLPKRQVAITAYAMRGHSTSRNEAAPLGTATSAAASLLEGWGEGLSPRARHQSIDLYPLTRIVSAMRPDLSPQAGRAEESARSHLYPRRRRAPRVDAMFRVPRNNEGAGKTGCALHPRSRVQDCAKKRTRAYRFSGSIPAFPAQWLYGL
jgi:hypothetical protein